ncbi:MAG: hypothetical protein ACKODX_20020 [Gemmata sp.]
MTTASLTGAELRDLRALVAEMIPASAAYDVPGADDETIFGDIVNSLERDTEQARTSLRLLFELSGGSFAGLDQARRREIAAAFKAQGGDALFALNRVVLLCYYRDDRVMRSLGQEPRPPFPKGHAVEQGDWSLLDPVRKRAPFWRRA